MKMKFKYFCFDLLLKQYILTDINNISMKLIKFAFDIFKTLNKTIKCFLKVGKKNFKNLKCW